MLGGMMPGQVVGDGLRGLGGREMAWVDAWFERWFLGGVGLTVGGIWLGKKLGSGGGGGGGGFDDWDDEDDVHESLALEEGKRS